MSVKPGDRVRIFDMAAVEGWTGTVIEEFLDGEFVKIALDDIPTPSGVPIDTLTVRIEYVLPIDTDVEKLRRDRAQASADE